MENVNQSLAGRTAILKLLPFSHREMKEGGIFPKNVDVGTKGPIRILIKNIEP